MPAKFRIKEYKTEAYYHIYNRGIEGMDVFCDEGDFLKFEELIRRYVMPVKTKNEGPYKDDRPSLVKRKQKMNLSGQVEIAAFVLMPNHFHLLVKQRELNGITLFMRRVMTAYMMYFNKRHQRGGPLFISAYKAILIEDPRLLLPLTKFIHVNPVTRKVSRFGPVETVSGTKAEDYPYSSYLEYIEPKAFDWIRKIPTAIEPNLYRNYVEDWKDVPERQIGKFAIDLAEEFVR